ncbi:carbohydrate-binding family 9-like protein, partial [Fervidibacter sacchari]
MFALGLVISLLTGFSSAQQTVVRSPQAPVLDGVPDDPLWSKAMAFELSHRLGGGETQVGTTVKMTFNDDHLFVLFVCDEPNPKAMKRTVRQRDGEVWRDDCAEVFLAPDPNEPSSYYHIVVNSLGIVRDEFWCDGKDDVGWDS